MRYCLVVAEIGDMPQFRVRRFGTTFGVMRALAKEYDSHILELDCEGYFPYTDDSLRSGRVVIRTRKPRGEDGTNPAVEAVVMCVLDLRLTFQKSHPEV